MPRWVMLRSRDLGARRTLTIVTPPVRCTALL